jgi:hypothetical protein
LVEDSAYLVEGTQKESFRQKILRLMKRLDRSPAIDQQSIAELRRLLHKHSVLVEEKRARFDEPGSKALPEDEARKLEGSAAGLE